eukprot:57580_1
MSVFINGYYKWLTFITMSSYILCTLGDISELSIRYALSLVSDKLDPSDPYLAGVKDILYYLGNTTLFLLILMRIKISFQVSRCIMIALSVLLLISTLLSIAWCACIFIATNATQRALPALYINFPLSINDLCLNMLLFALFIYKIKNKDSVEGIDNVYHNDCDYGKKRIWNVMIKHCVLFGIVLVANQGWYISEFLWSLCPTLSVALIMVYTVRTVENTINIVILWLVLKVNNAKYVKLCKCWHVCITERCLKQNPDMIGEGFDEKTGNENHNTLQDLLLMVKHKSIVEGHNVMDTLIQAPVQQIKMCEGGNIVDTQHL